MPCTLSVFPFFRESVPPLPPVQIISSSCCNAKLYRMYVPNICNCVHGWVFLCIGDRAEVEFLRSLMFIVFKLCTHFLSREEARIDRFFVVRNDDHRTRTSSGVLVTASVKHHNRAKVLPYMCFPLCSNCTILSHSPTTYLSFLCCKCLRCVTPNVRRDASY